MKSFIPFLILGVCTSLGQSTTCREPDPRECTGEHEVYTECGNDSCVRDCSTFGRTDIACRPSCNPGCICERGYIRNAAGVCVNPSQCENNVCPAKNEEFSECVSPCGETCQNLGQNIVCNFLVCNQGCACKPGFFRNGDGSCVPPEECDCGGESANQELDLCHNPCPPEGCEDIGKMVKCTVPEVCKPACKCKLNYKRDSSGQCVDIRECPQPFECKASEVYDACPGFCVDERCIKEPQLACSSIVWVTRPSPICWPECRCQEGHCRNEEGECVDKQAYESCGGDPNAYLAPCGDPCPLTCENKDNPMMCPAVCMHQPGCKCKPGFVRDFTGKCISPENCPKCGVNEVFKCGSACDTTCATLGEVCPIINKMCNLKCYCKDGFARNDKDVCIPISKCPPCKGDVNADPACGCKCKKGFMKNKSDKCVPIIRCTDPNSELVSCPNLCPGGTCENPTFSPCKIMCPEQGCQCKKGFVKKSSTDPTCIVLSKCPKKPICCTDPNSELVSCPNLCPGGTCENPTFSPCEIMCPEQGCQCKKGFVKKSSTDPTCIALNKCPKKPICCTDPNSELVSCPNPCPGGTCDSPTFSPCKRMCPEQGCQCKKGFVKKSAADPTCIALNKCPKKPKC